jgi:glc operon protein GlcG
VALTLAEAIRIVQGAVPIISNGVVDGACGTGGGTTQQDEDCARAGVATL